MFWDKLSKICTECYKTNGPVLTKLVHDVGENSSFLSLFYDFVEEYSANNETFKFWSDFLFSFMPVLREILRGDRESNWNLHISGIRAALPLFFAFNKVNYARWGSVYYQDCLNLKIQFPIIYKEFVNGHFSVQQTNRSFSSVALDQALEQCYNKPAKSTGGIIGMTRRKEAVAKHDLIKHEKCGISNFHRMVCGFNEDTEYEIHHEFSSSLTSQQKSDINKMIRFVKDHKNPFKIDNQHKSLSNIITGKEVTKDETSIKKNSLKEGETAYQTFVKERFDEKTKQLLDPIRKIGLNRSSKNAEKLVDPQKEINTALRFELYIF
jgi:hypothetical protein